MSKINCRAKAAGVIFLIIAIIPAAFSVYGVVSLAVFLMVFYFYTLIYLLL